MAEIGRRRLGLGAALAICCLVLHFRDAKADTESQYRLQVYASTSGSSICTTDSSGNLVTEEALAYDAVGNTACEVAANATTGASISTECSFNVSTHQAKVTRRDPFDFHLVSSFKSSDSVNWPGTSGMPSTTAAAVFTPPGCTSDVRATSIAYRVP